MNITKVSGERSSSFNTAVARVIEARARPEGTRNRTYDIPPSIR